MQLKGNAIIAQSGGPTAVINNSVYGVIKEWLQSEGVGTLYGALHGIRGVLQEEFIDLSSQSAEVIEGLKFTPGAALGSCRYKLRARDYDQILRVFKQRNIHYFFYVGGNDSMDTANRIQQLALDDGYEMRIIGIPKTIDNDLPFTDHCPGYGSAAKYVATTVMETGIDFTNLITSNKVTILETMGRNTGWLAATAAMARRTDDDVPHLIYLPEVPFSTTRFLVDVEEVYRRLGHVYVVVSEGVMDESGGYLFADLTRDAFGHVRLGGIAEGLKGLVERETGLKTRCNVLGTTQRSAMHYASQTDAAEAFMVGVEAVRTAIGGGSGLMMTLDRAGEDEHYHCITGSVALDRVANVERKMPLAWIADAGNDLRVPFLRYARPLIKGEVRVPTKNGLPDYVQSKDFRAKVS